MQRSAPVLPDSAGLEAYNLGRRINEFYFHALQAMLRNRRHCHDRKAADKVGAGLLGVVERYGGSRRDWLNRRIRDYVESWMAFLDSEDYVELWWSTNKEYGARCEGGQDPGFLLEECCRDFTYGTEVELGHFVDSICDKLGPLHAYLIRLGIGIDRGVRPLDVWRGMTLQIGPAESESAEASSGSDESVPTRTTPEVESISEDTIAISDAPRDDLRCLKHCKIGSIAPQLGWTEMVNALLAKSPYTQLQDIRLPDAAPASAIQTVQSHISQVLDGIPKPTWDSIERRLYFRGCLVKDWSRHKAEQQEKLIQAFQDVGWEQFIPDPFADDGRKTLQSTVDNFNRNPKGGIRFKVRGDYVCWEPVESESS
jgi:hypothetical protein